MDKNRMAGVILRTLMKMMANSSKVQLDARQGDIKLAQVPVGSPRTFNYYFYVRPEKMEQATDGLLTPRFQRAVTQVIRQETKTDYDFFVRPTKGPKGTFALEVGKPRTMWDDIFMKNLPQGHGLTVPVGIDSSRMPVRVDMSDPDIPHGLLAGKTGSGKSNLMLSLIWRLAMQNSLEEVRFLFIDVGKSGKDFRPFHNLRHLGYDVVTDLETAAQVVEWLLQEKRVRDQADDPLPHIFVFIEEATELTVDTQIADKLAALTRSARSSNIHIISAFQEPTKENVGNRGIVTNSGLRMVGKVADSIVARVAMGLERSGAERLVGRGDILIYDVSASSDPIRVVVPLMVEGDYKVLPRGESSPIVGDLPAVQRSGPGRPSHEPTDLEKARFLAEILRCVKTGTKPSKPYSIGRRSGEPMLSEGKSNRAWNSAIIIFKELRKRGVA